MVTCCGTGGQKLLIEVLVEERKHKKHCVSCKVARIFKYGGHRQTEKGLGLCGVARPVAIRAGRWRQYFVLLKYGDLMLK